MVNSAIRTCVDWISDIVAFLAVVQRNVDRGAKSFVVVFHIQHENGIFRLVEREKSCETQPSLEAQKLFLALKTNSEEFCILHIRDAKEENDEDLSTVFGILEESNQLTHVQGSDVKTRRNLSKNDDFLC